MRRLHRHSREWDLSSYETLKRYDGWWRQDTNPSVSKPGCSLFPQGRPTPRWWASLSCVGVWRDHVRRCGSYGVSQAQWGLLHETRPIIASPPRAHRLAVQDVALSRRKQGFESPWAHQ